MSTDVETEPSDSGYADSTRSGTGSGRSSTPEPIYYSALELADKKVKQQNAEVRPSAAIFLFFPSFLYLKQKKTRRSTPHTTTMAEETLQKKKGRKEIGRVPVLSGTPRPKKSTRLYGMGYLNFIF